jgi:methylmalonyl-CoA mutase cobalamin-binding subunit
VAIILAAVFWGWLWGPVGLLLSTPLTVCLVVLGHYVPRFRVFATLLGEKVDIAPSLLFYQRLLTKDHLRATEIFDSCIKGDSAMTAIDSVLVPTLRRVRKDLEAERLMPEQAAEVLHSIETVVANATWLSKDDPSNNVARDDQMLAKPNVLAIPAHLSSEELLLSAFAKANPLLAVKVGSNNAMPGQFADHAVRENPEAIVIYVLPQGGFTQANYLCRTVREAGYKGTIIICCSGKFRNFDRLFVKFRKAGANFMTTSLTQTAHKLSGLKMAVRDSKNELAPQLH